MRLYVLAPARSPDPWWAYQSSTSSDNRRTSRLDGLPLGILRDLGRQPSVVRLGFGLRLERLAETPAASSSRLRVDAPAAFNLSQGHGSSGSSS